MRIYPIGLHLEGRLCVVIGGSGDAVRKVKALLAAGARVRYIHPSVPAQLQKLVENGQVEWLPRAYQEGDLADAFLTIPADRDPEVNRRVFAEAERLGRLCNAVDDTAHANCSAPSVVQRGDLTLAVFTGGRSPMLARRVRKELEQQFGPEYGELLELLGDLRAQVLARVCDEKRRKVILHRMAEGPALELLRAGRREEALAALRAELPGELPEGD